MAQELQQLLEKIQHDGVEKAQAEAAQIRAAAQAEADACLANAHAEADALRAKAEKDATAFAERAEKTISQAARDTMLQVKESITKLLEQLLAQNVQKALTNTDDVVKLTFKILHNEAISSGDVATNAQLAELLKIQLAQQARTGIRVVLDETTGGGFSVRLDEGRVEHDFSEQAIQKALAKRLRPELAKLLN